jgi:hypothetical protein
MNCGFNPTIVNHLIHESSLHRFYYRYHHYTEIPQEYRAIVRAQSVIALLVEYIADMAENTEEAAPLA